MLVWPDVTYGRKINWKLTYRVGASCVCVGYLLTFLILYGSRAAMLPGSWIWEDDWHIWCWSRSGPLWPLSSTHHSPVTSLTSTQPGAFPASAETSLLCSRTLWSCDICVENDFRVNLFQSSLEIAIFRYLLSTNTPPDNCWCAKPLASSGIYIS